jgi:hypothetical protein
LKRCLTLYRLAFGQPRQDDLLDHLCTLNQTSIDSIGLPSSRFGSNPRSLRKPVR